VGFSGHRAVGDPAAVARTLASILESLRRELSGEWIALSSVADGSDQLFAREALHQGHAWQAVLPLPPAEFSRDFSTDGWGQVEALLARAEHVRVVAESGNREDSYLDCGMETVDGSDVLVALWDGEPARGKGGTAEVIDYARRLNKPVVIIDAGTLDLRRENFDRLPRTDAALRHLNHLPAHLGAGDNPFKAPNAIFAFQQKCDHEASRNAPHFRRLIVGTVLLHVLATLVAAASLAYSLHWLVLPWLKLLCLIGAGAVAIVLRRHQTHHGWVQGRLAAEFCRSALATWGLPRTAPLFEDLEVAAVRGLTRSLHILHLRDTAKSPVSMDEFRRTYLEKRIEDQLGYYRRQERRSLPLFSRLKFGFWISTFIALVSTLAYAVCRTMEAPVPHPIVEAVFYFAPIGMPVAAAAFISLISINDLQRRVARYREMQHILTESQSRLHYCRTWNSLQRVVLRTEHALLQEVLEWHSLTTFTESH
jgi:hypothetical protein